MKLITKLVLLTLLTLTVLGVAPRVYAQNPAEGPGGGVRGEVTAVSDSSLTITTLKDETLIINVTAETRIRLAETRSDGDLADIAVGNFVGARGLKNTDGSLTARAIVVLPENPRDLDRVRGQVSAIEGNVLVLDGPNGSVRVTTDDSTRVRVGQQPGSLTDINIDDHLLALGTKQGETDLLANYVVVVTAEQIKEHLLRGEVLSLDPAAGVLSVKGSGPKEETWTVQTTEDTKYRVPGVDNPSLADIAVGQQVLVVGRKTGDSDNSGVAWRIAVIPAEFKDSQRLGGKVTGLSGDTFTLSGPRGDFTVQTSAETRYRIRGGGDATFADITVGGKVLVVGQPVAGQDNTIAAQVVGIGNKP